MIKKLVLLLVVIIGLYGSLTAYRDGYVGIKTDKFSLMFEVPSYASVKENKNNLDNKVAELDNLNTSGIPNAQNDVKLEIENYEAKRKEYEDLAMSATADEIAEANKIEKYLLDYLWIRVGNYANDNNVKFKMTPVQSTATLDFDITGSYVSVINFIYDIQNDKELNFNINGIVIQGGSSDQIVKAKFTVEDINVVTSPEDEIVQEGGVNIEG
ncbi:MAG: hypothetical protein IJX99_08815 [Clostridia bacterium]|nr:hypothetical protein [Clostridia bacterium]